MPGGDWVCLNWENIFSSDPPSNSLVPVLDPWRAFWVDTALFKGPWLVSCDASGTKGHRQLCRSVRGGPWTLKSPKNSYCKLWLSVCRKHLCFCCSKNWEGVEGPPLAPPSDLKAQSNALLNWLFSLSRWAWPWGLAELTPGKPVHAQEGTGSEKPVCKHLWKLRPEHRVRSLL